MTKGLVVAGLAGGSGKSVVSVGLTAALTQGGHRVAVFKKGPDYIDAGWLQQAAAGSCYNLDPYLMNEATIRESFMAHAHGADLAILEGNRGLFDGVNPEGGYSTAELALSLKLPVLLVVNCTKTTRTVAAMVLGCLKFDERLDIRGVVLNHIATERQRSVVTRSVEHYTGVPVLGIVPRFKRDIFPMRHLGMVPHQEYNGRDEALSFLVDSISANLDLEKVKEIMAEIATIPLPCNSQYSENSTDRVKIGILQDAAFQFYYASNLEALEQAGAELVPINALEDQQLPDIDGLYIGGGFPETSAKALSDNAQFRNSVKTAAEKGMPIYAECGGLIYLGESLVLEGREYPLTGVFPVRFGMSEKPQAHGYSIFEVDGENPFYEQKTVIKGHEFRYSTILDWKGDVNELAFKMKRGKGFVGGRDGLTKKNVLALYTHVHASGTPSWAVGFFNRCRSV